MANTVLNKVFLLRINKPVFSISIILFLPFILNAQTIKVMDITSLQALPYVNIYSDFSGISTTTDNKGKADISSFKNADSICFKMVGYNPFISSYNQLEKNNFKVHMTEKQIMIDEFVISAHRWEEKQEDIPNQITKITPREITFQNPQTSADMISNTGEVFVQKSQLGGGSPMIRGFSANSILLVVDGVRMNNAIYRSGNLQNVLNIDPNSLKSSEILFGPGSVLYGSDALGGVINFSTKSPVMGDSSSSLIFGNALARYGSANNEKTGHVNINIGFNKIASFTSFSYSDFDNLKTGRIRNSAYPDYGKRSWFVQRIENQDSIVQNSDPDIQKFSGFNQFNGMQKLRYKPSKSLDFEYGFYYSITSDIPRYDRLIEITPQGLPRNAQWHYGPQNWMMHALNTSVNKSTIAFDKLNITLAYQNYKESRHDRRFNSEWLRSQMEEVNIFSANIDLKKNVGKRSELYYGIENFSNFVDSKANTTNIVNGEQRGAASRYPDGGSKVYSASGYVQFVRKITNKITVSTGARYNYYTLKSRITDSTFFNFPYDQMSITTSAVTGAAGFVYLPNEKWKINFNAASGYRAPNVDDIAKVFDSEPGRVIVPNNDLKPEYSYNVEVGISRTFLRKYTLSSSAYYTLLIDAIERRDARWYDQDSIVYDGVLSKVTSNINIGKGYISGISANLAAEFTHYLVASFSITYTEGMDLNNAIPLRHIPPLFGRISVMYKYKGIRMELFSHFSGWRYYEQLAPEEQAKTHLYTPQGAPAWFTLNFRSSLQINDFIQINAGIENILDHHYRPFSSGISAPGRNIFVALRLRF
ncbi:MAG: TonB-dependent receptor [Bacteroidetes bacterium]|nr:TonB-dependent receptor [Bacteroidota bacterium]HET6245495.1 TonB-dependent receptor [Bacteroidia bacterium]